MKLYAKIEASKLQDGKYITVKKGQGSNDQINITINIDGEYPSYRLHINKRDDDSTDVTLVDLSKPWPKSEVFHESIKGNNQKNKLDEHYGQHANDDGSYYCDDCQEWANQQ